MRIVCFATALLSTILLSGKNQVSAVEIQGQPNELAQTLAQYQQLYPGNAWIPEYLNLLQTHKAKEADEAQKKKHEKKPEKKEKKPEKKEKKAEASASESASEDGKASGGSESDSGSDDAKDSGSGDDSGSGSDD